MAKILTVNSKSQPPEIEKEANKENFFKKLWESFQSLDKFTKLFVIFIILFLIAVPYIKTHYFDIRQRGSTSINFVTRTSGDLYLDGQKFRFSGANIHWLGLFDEMIYPSHFQIDDVLATAQEMGTNVIRSHTLGISVGNSKSIEPSLNNFNDGAFEPIDYAINSAKAHDIRLIIPLVANGHAYFGGKSTFTTWRGLTDEDGFYTDSNVITDFENYISHILNHVNPYTGIALKDDPTILAWETGNELDAVSWTSANDAWTEKIATYIKSLAPNQLVADGHSADSKNPNTHLTTSQLGLAHVDMYAGHFYPMDSAFMQIDSSKAQSAGKVYFVGEYDSSEQDSLGGHATIVQSSDAFSGAKSALINIQNSVPNAWYVQLQQKGINLSAGVAYNLNFYAKADQARTIEIGIQQDGGSYTEYSTQIKNITTSWQPYSIQFTPSTNVTVFISFNLASTAGNVWLDNVSFSPASLQNGSFETTSTTGDLFPGWVFNLKQDKEFLSTFLPAIKNTPTVSGDLYWDLYPHNDRNGYYTAARDKYIVYYPGLPDLKTFPQIVDMQTRLQEMRSHAYDMRSIPVPASTLGVPLTHQISNATGGGKQIDWRGAVGAAKYNIERSQDGINWQVVASGLAVDQGLYTDTTASSTSLYSYRVKPIAVGGTEGLPSNVEPQINGLVQNSSFEHDGIYWNLPWVFDVKTGAAGTLSQDASAKVDGNYSARINVTQGSSTNPWYVALVQQNLLLTSGKTYMLSFKAKADANRNIVTGLQQAYSPYNIYYEQTVPLSTSWQQITCSYQSSVNESNSKLNFNVAQTTGNVWIDDVKLSLGSGSSTNCVASSLTSSSPTPTPASITVTQPIQPTNTSTPTPTPVLVTQPVQPTNTPTPVSGDTTPPTVSITSPVNGAVLTRNSSFTISANASDNVRVTKVEFYIDGNLRCSDTTYPYSCTAKINAKSGTTHTIIVKAYDAGNNSSTNSIIVTIK